MLREGHGELVPALDAAADRLQGGLIDAGAAVAPAASAFASGIPAGRSAATALVKSSTAAPRPNPKPPPVWSLGDASSMRTARRP
jgi:hypothetical protein